MSSIYFTNTYIWVCILSTYVNCDNISVNILSEPSPNCHDWRAATAGHMVSLDSEVKESNV
jgi:hypothetical protein